MSVPTIRGDKTGEDADTLERLHALRKRMTMPTLPYRAVTSSGSVIDVAFELHPETVSSGRVGEVLSAILNALDAQVEGGRTAANGDVLQAVAMALALRAEMLPAPRAMKEQLTQDVVARALKSVAGAERGRTGVGHA